MPILSKYGMADYGADYEFEQPDLVGPPDFTVTGYGVPDGYETDSGAVEVTTDDYGNPIVTQSPNWDWNQFNPLAGSGFPASTIIQRPISRRPPAPTTCGMSNPGACLTPVTAFISRNTIPIIGGLFLLFVLSAPFAPAGNIRPLRRSTW